MNGCTGPLPYVNSSAGCISCNTHHTSTMRGRIAGIDSIYHGSGNAAQKIFSVASGGTTLGQ